MKKWKWRPVYLAGLICVCGCSLNAADEGTRDPDDWDVRLGLPIWISGAEGEVGVLGKDAEVDESFSDILDVLDFTAAINLEVRKSRWLFFVDGLYLKTSTEAQPRGALSGFLANVELAQKQAGGNIAIGYAVVETDPFTLELYVGGRINYVELDLSLDLPIVDRGFSGSKFWADPIVGLRGQYRFTDTISLYAKGDIGGFGVASDLTWQVEGGFEFDVTKHFYFRLAYRFLSTDFEDDGFRFDVDTSGPLIELGLHF